MFNIVYIVFHKTCLHSLYRFVCFYKNSLELSTLLDIYFTILALVAKIAVGTSGTAHPCVAAVVVPAVAHVLAA